MMHEHWTDRLSEYLDEELPPVERAEVEAHLAGCTECQGVLEQLRQVVRSAASVRDEPPARDLWAGIEARLGPVAESGTKVISLTERRRHFAFTLPQLAAASVALMAVSAGVMWLLVMRGPSGAAVSGPLAAGRPAVSTPAVSGRIEAGTSRGPATQAAPVAGSPEAVPAAGAALAAATGRPQPRPENRVQLVRSGRALSPEARADRDYNRAVADLESVLRKERSRLKPETVQALEASLADIDKAIGEARKALARDPANVYLNAHLAESRRLKLELLQQVATITQS